MDASGVPGGKIADIDEAVAKVKLGACDRKVAKLKLVDVDRIGTDLDYVKG